MSRRLIATLALGIVIVFSDVVCAQDTSSDVSADRSASCRRRAASLLEVVTRTKWLIQHGTGRSPADICKLVHEAGVAEWKLIEYLTSEDGIPCGIAAGYAAQMKAGYRKVQAYRERTCLDARQSPSGPPVVSDFGDPIFGYGWRR